MKNYLKSKYLAAVGFIGSIPLANYLISNIGTVCSEGVCLIPVGFGLMAPSGVLVVGLSLALRDYIHESFGIRPTILMILLGALLSFILANPYIAVASAVSYLVSELMDAGVYSWLREKSKPLGILMSGAVGSVVDGVLFVLIAFGSLEFSLGNILGKYYSSLAYGVYKWCKK